jgi:hypothetical protein
MTSNKFRFYLVNVFGQLCPVTLLMLGGNLVANVVERWRTQNLHESDILCGQVFEGGEEVAGEGI